MRLRSLSLAVLLGACAAVPPASTPGPITELNGRVARPPVSCVTLRSGEALRPSGNDPHALLYGSGATIWLNRLYRACSFRADDILVTEPLGSSLCRGEIVRSFDRLSRIAGPSCVLGDFVPYSRPPR